MKTIREDLSRGIAAFWRHRTAFALFGLVLGIGIWARFFQLAGHFTHTDDLGIAEYIFSGQARHNIFFLPQSLTNAPFQYLFTYFLISPSMGYLEILFWGRLSSCIAGCLALGVLAFFYYKYDKTSLAKAFFALTLLACSWENIAFAKQMHSYAIGVLAATLVFVLFITQLRDDGLDLKRAAVTGGVLALVSYMQYQALLFVPAFYLALFLFYICFAKSKIIAVRNLFLSGLLYLALVFPLWHFFLKLQYGAFAANARWALGASGQYGLDPALFRDLGTHGPEILRFFLKNLFVIFEAKTGFFPEAEPFFKLFSAGLFSLFLLGIVNFFISPNKKTRFLGLFFGLVLLTWWAMALYKQLPYGPSRHTLVLLPFFTVATAEGIEGLSRILRYLAEKELPAVWQQRILVGMGLLVIVLFLAYYGRFIEERKNPLIEKEICDVLAAYDVDVVFSDQRGFHLEYMKGYQKLAEEISQKKLSEIRTFAILTRYPAASVIARCEAYQNTFNVIALKNTVPPSLPILIREPCKDFHVVFEKKSESNITETFSRETQTSILTNRFYFYILSLDPEKKAIGEKLEKQGREERPLQPTR